MATENNKFTDKQIAHIRNFKTTILFKEDLVRWGAHSMGIGAKEVNQKETNRPCLRIYVSNKVSKKNLREEQIIPPYFKYHPKKGKRSIRIFTDVIQEPMLTFQAIDPKERIRPAPGGVSGGKGQPFTGGGTIGGYAWDPTDETIVMLSNFHVFGREQGMPIAQPSFQDGGLSPENLFGHVKRGLPLNKVGKGVNSIDCAIALPLTVADVDLEVCEIGPAVYSIEEASIGMKVEKFGSRTGFTKGKISDVEWEGFVTNHIDNYYFISCIRIKPSSPHKRWSDTGDSGSLVFSSKPIANGSKIKSVVGLHFGGSKNGIACKIQNVFARLALTTLCDGVISTFLDNLFYFQGSQIEETPNPLFANNNLQATPFSKNMYSGISRDIESRLKTSIKGRRVIKFVKLFRHEILCYLLKDGDIRRSAIKAIGSFAEGTITSSEFLRKKLSSEDLINFARLAKEASAKSGRKMKIEIKFLLSLIHKSEGKSISEILGIRL